MKSDALLWIGVATYFLVIAVIYYLAGGEPVGLAANIACSAAGGLVAGWLYRDKHPSGTEAAERDTVDGDIEVGTFPSASLRPAGLGLGMVLFVIGFPLGSWMVVAGAAIIASQVGLMIRDQDG